MTLTVGSLCTGYGGIEQALRLAGWDTEPIWVADNDPAASKLLAHRYPDVPNLGDIARVDWTQVQRPDVVTAGFPCTDISCAGRRLGLGIGTRSGVWAHVAEAIAVLRPDLVVIENVAALLSTLANRSADADPTVDRGVEPGPPGVGDGAGRPVLRALGAVLGDLSTIGFDAVWATVSAASIGAPHKRDRVFVLAWPADQPADAKGIGHGYPWTESGQGLPAPAVGGAVRPAGGDGVALLPTPAARLGDSRGTPSTATAGRRIGTEGRRNLDDAVALPPTPTARDGDGRGEGGPDYWARRRDELDRSNGLPLGAVVNLLPTPTSADTTGPGGQGCREGGPNLRTEVALLPTPQATDGTNGGPNQRDSHDGLALPSAVVQLLPTPVVADARGSRNVTAGCVDPKPTTTTTSWTLSDVAFADRWGRYAAAIARWEQILGRPAPDPTEPGTKGQPRLSPRFVEWMQGLPDGWVTAAPGLSRNDMLRLLGNGVVPQQGAAGIRHLAGIAADLSATTTADAT